MRARLCTSTPPVALMGMPRLLVSLSQCVVTHPYHSLFLEKHIYQPGIFFNICSMHVLVHVFMLFDTCSPFS